MLSAEASTSPWNLTSPSRPASATATALRSFATSIPTNASLISAMVRPPMVRRGSYHSPDHRGAASLIRVAPHRERTYGLTRLAGEWQAAGHDNLVVSLLPGGELAPSLRATGARVAEIGLARR